MKDDAEIKKELYRLVIAELEAGLVYKYYTKQATSMLEAQNASMKALMESAKVDDLTNEEREQLRFKLRQSELESNACKEITTHIQRLADKAYRKVNEAEQKLKAFCKRHNIENVDEYLKDLKR
jgi:ribosomal protein S13